MSELNKERFGAFVAQLRREKGWTQKELAEKLFVSDKAVSKWERGLSLPDIALLEPMGELLGVTVTELLRGERMGEAPLEKEEVEELVAAAAQLSRGAQAARRTRSRFWRTAWCLSAAGSCLGCAALLRRGLSWGEFWYGPGLVALLCLIFGFWACFLMQETLPVYYDQYKVRFYHDGMFRMSLPGVSFNNSNWPHITRVMRVWMTVTPVLFQLLYGALLRAVPAGCGEGWKVALVLLASVGFFLPTIVAGRKYQ